MIKKVIESFAFDVLSSLPLPSKAKEKSIKVRPFVKKRLEFGRNKVFKINLLKQLNTDISKKKIARLDHCISELRSLFTHYNISLEKKQNHPP